MEPFTAALQAFVEDGLTGAACVVLAFVVFFLWREGKLERATHKTEMAALSTSHKAEVTGLQKRLSDLADTRIGDWKEMSAARLADAETLHKQMLDVVKQCTTVMESTAAALDGHADVSVEHRAAAKEAAEELRKLSSLIHNLSEEFRARLRR